jgi:hypothetical protein
LAASLVLLAGAAHAQDRTSNESLYLTSCATCHGADGTGGMGATVAFAEALPDFTDCSFASREPDADWVAVAHDGGPVRGFSRMMPAFGDALSEEDLQRTVRHIRSFCDDDSWAPGELNMPRALFTEKAFPEDEIVMTTFANLDGRGAVVSEFIYERRYGARTQFELILPLGSIENAEGDWNGGFGDLALGVKHVVLHNAGSGSILSFGGELIFPTGDADSGLGKGTTVVEPFLLFGQALPSNGFLHTQGGFEFPLSGDLHTELFLRAAIGKTFVQNRWGRAWSPMIEILAARDLAEGESINWDLAPQVQVTLNTRQHVMLNAGVRFPLTDSEFRSARFVMYVLWEWFDGGLFDGW